MERPDGRRFAFVVSHPSSKRRSMDGAHPKFHLLAGRRRRWVTRRYTADISPCPFNRAQQDESFSEP
jgi:hypothetical protein